MIKKSPQSSVPFPNTGNKKFNWRPVLSVVEHVCNHTEASEPLFSRFPAFIAIGVLISAIASERAWPGTDPSSNEIKIRARTGGRRLRGDASDSTSQRSAECLQCPRPGPTIATGMAHDRRDDDVAVRAANRLTRRRRSDASVDSTNVARLRRKLLPLNKLRLVTSGGFDKHADM
jgi:hypothetical protein